MTDNELKKWNKDAEDRIVKALECCRLRDSNICIECSYCDNGCSTQMSEDVLDLINRQKSEIERLQELLDAAIAGQESLQDYVAEQMR